MAEAQPGDCGDVGVEHPGRSVEVVAASHIVEIAAAGIFDQWQTAVPGRP
jgi:hypothetical protein